MSESEDLFKALSDFIKGKSGPPDASLAKLAWDGPEPPPLPDFPDLNPVLEGIAKESPIVTTGLSRCALLPTVAMISGMLTLPELQSNCVRLEALAHLALMFSKGKQRPTAAQLSAWFNQLDNGTCGRLEDPAEDVFTANVYDGEENYRLFEGTAEGNAFHTQIILNILESMPTTGGYVDLKRSIRSLLKLSDIIAERGGLSRNIVGSTRPHAKIPKPKGEVLNEVKRRAIFTPTELAAINVSIDDLQPFCIQKNEVQEFHTATLRNSPLEAKPLVNFEDCIIVALPTAIGIAIRRFFLEGCLARGLNKLFEQALANAYSLHFHDEHILGDLPHAPIIMQYRDGYHVANVSVEFDEGRYLHLSFFCDNLHEYEVGGFAGVNPVEAISRLVSQSIDTAYEEFSAQPNFKEGLSLVVGCGWGRALGLELPADKPSWRVEMLPAHDLTTLSRTPSFKAIDLLRILEAQDRITKQGVTLVNANGLLNLYGWMKSNNGHIVPHEKLDNNFLSGAHGAFLTIPQNSIVKVRYDALQSSDIHRVRRPDGSCALVVRTNGTPRYGSTALSPFYADIDALRHRRFCSVYEGGAHNFWVRVSVPESLDIHTVPHLGKMVLNWAECVASHIAKSGRSSTHSCFSWDVNFLDDETPKVGGAIPTPEEIAALFHIEQGAAVSTITVGKGFLSTGRRADNSGEREMVRALVKAGLSWFFAPLPPTHVEEVVSSIIDDDGARHFHAFDALDVRDYVRGSVPDRGQVITTMDDTNSRLGLGWLVRNRSEGEMIEGREACCQYLNELVKAVAQRMKDSLSKLNRIELIRALIVNHEALASEADLWQRTFRAIRSLSEDEDRAVHEASEKIGTINAGSLASRIAAEMALCESPLEGGFTPGAFDIAQLLADASLMFHFGGYSDAMMAGVMSAIIRVSPAGDVLMDHSFTDRVVRPFGEKFQSRSLSDAAGRYPTLYAMSEATEETTEFESKGGIDERFKAAWIDEFHFSFEETRRLAEAFRELAIRREQAVIILTHSELMRFLVETTDFDEPLLRRMIDTFTIFPRPKWDAAPAGMLSSAWQPWRFRRQLSIVSKPLIRLEEHEASMYLIAPAMAVHHISKFVADALFGQLDIAMFQRGGKLSGWIGATNKKQGEDFNERVAERFRKFGWNAKANLSDGEILNRAKDPSFGDVDVLAWSSQTGEVLVIECKDLSLDKTFGEIARRLAKYRGATTLEGRRDELRRHLDRYEALERDQTALARFIGGNVTQLKPVLLFSQPTPLQFYDNVTKQGVTMLTLDEAESVFPVVSST